MAVTFDTGNLNAGLITIHPKKFNDKILKNKNLVWNTLLNSTNSEPLIGETVEKQSNEPNSILTQRNDLSTNNYDGIPNLQINYSLSNQNNTSDNDYLAAVENGDMETAQRMVDEAARKAGYKFQMFHQTDADNIHIFDIGLGTHGRTDSETPYGIFTKGNRNDLGLGKNQMPLYVLQWYENCPSSNIKAPIAVLGNFSESAHSGSVVVLTDMNVNGTKVIIPVIIESEAMADENKIDSHIILTVYDKKDWLNSIVEPAIVEENKGRIGIFYLKKKPVDMLPLAN